MYNFKIAMWHIIFDQQTFLFVGHIISFCNIWLSVYDNVKAQISTFISNYTIQKSLLSNMLLKDNMHRLQSILAVNHTTWQSGSGTGSHIHQHTTRKKLHVHADEHLTLHTSLLAVSLFCCTDTIGETVPCTVFSPVQKLVF